MTTSLYDSNQLLLKCEAAHTALLMEKRFQAHLEKLLQRISLSTLQAFKVGAVEVSQKGQFTLIPYFVGGMCKDLRAFDGGIPLSSSKVKDPPLYNGDAIVPGEPITIVSSPLRVLELHSQNVPAVAPFLRTFTAKNAKELHKASEIYIPADESVKDLVRRLDLNRCRVDGKPYRLHSFQQGYGPVDWGPIADIVTGNLKLLEVRLLLFVLRKTSGFRSERATTTHDEIEQVTRIRKDKIQALITVLEEKGYFSSEMYNTKIVFNVTNKRGQQ